MKNRRISITGFIRLKGDTDDYIIDHLINENFTGCPLTTYENGKIGWVDRVYTIGDNRDHLVFDLSVTDNFELGEYDWISEICVYLDICKSNRLGAVYKSNYCIESVDLTISDENPSCPSIYFDSTIEDDTVSLIVSKLDEVNEHLKLNGTIEISDDIITHGIELIDDEWINGSYDLAYAIRIPIKECNLSSYKEALDLLTEGRYELVEKNPHKIYIPLIFHDLNRKILFIAGYAAYPYADNTGLFYRINSQLTEEAATCGLRDGIFQEEDGEYIISDRVNSIVVVCDNDKKDVLCYCVDICSKDFIEEE